MKLGEFLQTIERLKKTGVITDDTPLVYSSDEEGNSYDEVYYGPTVGLYHEGLFMTTTDIKQLEEAKLDLAEVFRVKTKGKIVICIT